MGLFGATQKRGFKITFESRKENRPVRELEETNSEHFLNSAASVNGENISGAFLQSLKEARRLHCKTAAEMASGLLSFRDLLLINKNNSTFNNRV